MNQEATKLVEYLERLPVDDSQASFPVFVVAFDEAHALCQEIPHLEWTVFSCLQRAICDIKPWAFFFFLSTSGKICQSTVANPFNAMSPFVIMDPFTATGFDHHAPDLKKIAREKKDGKLQTDLEVVTSLRWQSLQSRAMQVFLSPVSSS
jgi:hypothetical protein